MPLILAASMLLALLMVVIGVIAMAKNGNFNKKYSNKLMRMRVLFQGIAVFVFAAIVYLAR
ncbi:MAG: twin transmembrane helix small protein [Pelagibacteraceae bacterium]